MIRLFHRSFLWVLAVPLLVFHVRIGSGELEYALLIERLGSAESVFPPRTVEDFREEESPPNSRWLDQP